MYVRAPETKPSLADDRYFDFCKQQAAKYKFADQKNACFSLEEKVALLPAQLTRWLFKNRIGHLPYEVEDVTGERQLYYTSFDVAQKIKDIDRNFVELMSGSKFSAHLPSSPKKVQFMKNNLQTEFGYKTLTRVESDLLESVN